MSVAGQAIRKHLLVLVLAILIVDAIAIAIFRIYRIELADDRTKAVFTGAWMLVSLLIVLNGLYRIRLARNAARRRR
jgi:hypothetical protein